MSDVEKQQAVPRRVSHRIVVEIRDAWRHSIAWWAGHANHGSAFLTSERVPLAVSRHELSEILTALEREPGKKANVPVDLVHGASGIGYSRFPRPPWNTKTDGRLKSFVSRHAQCVWQPDVAILAGAISDIPSGADVGLTWRGRDGLERLWEAIGQARPVAGQKLCGLLFFDRALLTLGVKSNRSQIEKALDDLEYVMALSIERLDRARRFRPDPSWRDEGASPEAATALADLAMLLRPRAHNPDAGDEPPPGWSKPSDHRLACIVARRGPGAGDIAIVHAAILPGGFHYARQKLISLFNFTFRKWISIAAVVQLAWIERAAAEKGDCAPERDIFQQALAAAERGQEAIGDWKTKTVFAVMRVDVAMLERIAKTPSPAAIGSSHDKLAELFVKDARTASHRRWTLLVLDAYVAMASATRGRKNQRAVALAVHKRLLPERKKGIYPGAHERSVHREARPPRVNSRTRIPGGAGVAD